MTFEEIWAQVIEVLQREGRISYRALQRRFDLDDAYLEDMKIELIEAKQLASDENGRILVWAEKAVIMAPPTTAQEGPPGSWSAVQTPQAASTHGAPSVPEAERRQLTVLFCDLADSTRLARQFDPEDWRNIVRAYQQACAEVIQRFDGYIAQYLGDGLLVYFGYPQAHEDDAQRAGRTGLGILDAMGSLNARLEQERGVRLAVRVGVDTGPVVVGTMGSGGRQEQLALGDTPNIAARLQGLAAPNTVVVSAATLGLIEGFFTCQALGERVLKGVDEPLRVFQLLAESGVRTRLDVVTPRGLTPLVGREQEVGLLLERWTQSTEGRGQVVLLSGEAGIGKSRLVQVLHESITPESYVRVEWRCSPYAQQSPLHPVIAHLHRLLRWRPDDPPGEKLCTLEETLAAYGFALPEVVPLLAALLALPSPAQYLALSLTPQRQREKTLEALLAWFLAEAKRQPVLFIVEDVHWIDPSTLEFLTLLIDQGPTARLLTLLTYRPEFAVPWGVSAHCTPLTLTRLPQPQIAQMIRQVAGGKTLPSQVVEQIVTKTDGVPLFVEELTKMVLESGLLQEREGRYTLCGPLPPLAIPATLHDSLMARLDRLATVKGLAQLGATLGREFSYALLQAVSPWDEETLQRGLQQLVEVEFLYQRGRPPLATYLFKHALIQEEAYQSLLRSTRQQYHQRIARVLEERFPDVVETQPELLAQHYTVAGLIEPAVGYWQRAGQQARQRSANAEAVQHLTTGLTLLATLPDTPARAQQELDLLLALGPSLLATKGRGAPEVEQTYARARALCTQVGDTPQLFPTLRGLCRFYYGRGALPIARELGEQLYRLAQGTAEPTHLLEAHDTLGNTLFMLGDYAAASTHLAQGIALIDPSAERALVLRHGEALGVRCSGYGSWALWCLGFPAQALQRSQEMLALAQALAHPYSLVQAQHYAAFLHQRRREASEVQGLADAILTLATAQRFPLWVGYGTFWRGWALAAQGQSETGMAQMHQGLTAFLATGQIVSQSAYLVILAEAAEHAGQVAQGLHLLAEAQVAFEASGRCDGLAEASRLQGALLLRQAVPDVAQAEACFQQALSVARRQEAKAWELRAAMSLSRLWQNQGKQDAACELLAPIYGWFTEGFDTADLQEAKALLEELG